MTSGSDDESTLAGDEPPAPPPRAHQAIFPPGTILHHSYEVIELIASGGMGEVYRCRNIALNEDVAIKCIRADLAADPQLANLLRREAKTLKGIRHDAVVRFEACLTEENGRILLVTDYIEGQTLARKLREGALSEREIRTLAA